MSKANKGRRIALGLGGIVVVAVVLTILLCWTEIRGWYFLRRDFERMGRNAQGCLEYKHRQTGIVFVGIPGGTFLMGSLKDEEWRRIDEYQHEVKLSPFLIAKYEVTQAEWKRVMEDKPLRFIGEKLPVDSVSWADCNEFCRKTGLSLPTEGQWEYACKARTQSAYYSGDTEEDLATVGWYRDNSGERSHPVGQKLPNDFGLHDMHGNVWEFCEDVWDWDFYTKPEATGTNPVCTSGSQFHVMRGGSWIDLARDCRSAIRNSGSRVVIAGLRPAWSPPR